MNLSLDSIIPATGEFVLSPNPGGLVVTLVNDTGLLAGHGERLAVICRIGDQVPSATKPGYFTTQLEIRAIREVHGRLPGPEVPKTDEGMQFLTLVAPRLEASINKWESETSQADKEAVWAMREDLDPLKLLEQILTGKFTA